MPAIPDSVPLLDGWSTLIGGMDAERRPRLIGPNQYSSGINITTRGGWPMTRPAWTYKTLIFENDENEEWFKTQIFQGGIMYQYVGFNQTLGQANEVFVCSVGGRIWKIDKCSFVVEEITPGGRAGRNSRCKSIAYFCQAEQFLVIQDGEKRPIIWDGGTAFRSRDGQVPVGTIMAYGQGRIWLVRGPQILAGDLVGSYPNAVIGFTELSFLATNGIIYPSSLVGNMTGLQFIPQQDTATGIGTLLVIGENGIASIFAEKERSQWVTGIARVTLINIGGTGHRAVVGINGDIWFEAKDGWRSYRHARGEVDKWYQLPMSEEVGIYTQTSAPNLKPYTSGIFFDNRLLATTDPIWQNGRCSSRGMLALDFNALSSFGEATKPAWDGLWTGVNILQLIRGKDTAWAFGIDEAGATSLYQLATTANTPDDDTGLTGSRRIECELITGAYVFDNGNRAASVGAQAQKVLWGGDLWIRDLAGRAMIDTYYRRDGEKCFQFWKDFDICSDVDLCTRECAFPSPIQQYRNRLRQGSPSTVASNTCSTLPANATNTGRLYVGYEFQEKIAWRGRLTLSMLRIQAMVDKKEPDLSGCDPNELECSIMENCCYDPFSFTPQFPPYVMPPFPPSSPGCVDPAAINYDPLAEPGDGSCIYPLGGCTDPEAFNFDPLATFDNGSCIPRVYGCMQSGSTNFDPEANTDDGSCIPCVYGCTDSSAFNYDPEATCDDGNCDSPSGGEIGCCCPLVSVPTPPAYLTPPGAVVDCELKSYKDSANAAPPGGYKMVVGQQIINGARGDYYDLICYGTERPTLLGVAYFDDVDGVWFSYDPISSLPGGSNSIYIVNFYSTGLNVWHEIYSPGYSNTPAYDGGVFDSNLGPDC